MSSVENFLYRQAEMLDSRRWQDFVDLFTDDGMYWMPASPDHQTWLGTPSIFAEHRDLMVLRMKRLQHPRAWSQQATFGTSRIVSNIVIESDDATTGEVIVRSRFRVDELRGDDQRGFAGSYRHVLARNAGGFRIRLQRVDLLDAQAPFDSVLQVWI